MKKVTITINAFALFAIMALMTTTAFAQTNNKKAKTSESEIASLRKQIAVLTAGTELTAKYLVKFDTLDFTVFSNQEWVRFHESHSNDILVHWPDGHTTTGLQKHIEDLKYMFIYAPNTSIKQHPIRFGSANFTCVTGIMTGTFTQPMPIGDGKFIQPTGKSFSLPMCTVGIWKDGVMVEEYLYWDNQTYMNQLGLGK